MIELSLLKAFLNRKNFENYKHLLNTKSLSTDSIIILKDYMEYYSRIENSEWIDLGEFSTFFFNIQHPTLDDKSVLKYKEIFDAIENNANSDNIEALILGFEQQEFYATIQRLIDNDVNSLELENKITVFNERTKDLIKEDLYENMDIDKALAYTDRTNGLQWRCKALREHFQGGVIQGDFIVVAALPDAGKSSFCASELSYMAQQLKDDEHIVWLSNEGDYKSALPRLWQAALNCTIKDLTENKERAKLKYKELMKGNINRVQLVNIQGWTAQQIESLIKKKQPKLIAIDMLDNINGFDKFMSKEGGTELYRKLYQWAREVATKYAPVIGFSQMNAEAEDKMYPSLHNLRGSKIDKQAACTFQLMIGSLASDNTTRYLSSPKNKVNENKTWKAIVKFDASRSRFI